MRTRFEKFLSALVVCFAPVVVHATDIAPGGELQSILDGITDGSFLDVDSDQYSPDERWQIGGGTETSANRLLFEFATFSDSASFGIYDLLDIANMLLIFGTDSDGTLSDCVVDCNNNRTLEILGNGDIAVSGGFGDSYEASASFGSGTTFGYYLNTGSSTFYSQASDNGGSDHMLAFKCDGILQIDISGGTDYSTCLDNEWIFAWEGDGDNDFADYIVSVESVYPVPEPSVLGLLGLGLVGLGMAGRRRRASLI